MNPMILFTYTLCSSQQLWTAYISINANSSQSYLHLEMLKRSTLMRRLSIDMLKGRRRIHTDMYSICNLHKSLYFLNIMSVISRYIISEVDEIRFQNVKKVIISFQHCTVTPPVQNHNQPESVVIVILSMYGWYIKFERKEMHY